MTDSAQDFFSDDYNPNDEIEQKTQSYLDELNPAQREAVEFFDNPLLVLAGAGTGKTRVITYKIVNIIRQKLSMPWNILAVTFTNKAAKEMQSRIMGMLGADGKGVVTGTFHSLGARFLRRNHGLANLSEQFTIIDPQDQKKIIEQIMEANNIDNKVFNPKNVASIISNTKEKRVKPAEIKNQAFVSRQYGQYLDLEKFYIDYCNRLKELDCVDFDDLILRTVEALENNEQVRQEYQSKFKFILVDEYQDINPLQYQMVKLFLGDNKNICCVGDDDQSIYGWRGAEVDNILRFDKDFNNAKIVRLEDNYRSTKEILDCANSVIANNQKRFGKDLKANVKASNPVEIALYDDSKLEARAITYSVHDLVSKKKQQFKNCAVLVRATSQTRLLEEALMASSIPYQIIGGLRFYERKEVKDIIAYLRLTLSTKDDIAFERAVSYPKKGVGDASIRKLIDLSRERGCTLMEAFRYDLFEREGEERQKVLQGNDMLFGVNAKVDDDGAKTKSTASNTILKGKGKAAMTKFFHDLDSWRHDIEIGTKLDTITKRIISDISYYDALKKDEKNDYETRMENVVELIGSLKEFDTLEEFIEYASLVNEKQEESDDNKVSVMTMHASKGLEFPVVYLPFWDDGSFPNKRVIDESGSEGLEEERRLAYVAITRAMRQLYVSHSKVKFIFGQMEMAIKSRFIEEINDNANINSYKIVNNTYFDESRQGCISYSGNYRKKKYDKYGDDEYCEKKQRGEKAKKRQEYFDNQVMDSIAQDKNPFKDNSIVKHKKFGIGKVLKADGLFCTCMFESGDTKTIRCDFLVRG